MKALYFLTSVTTITTSLFSMEKEPVFTAPTLAKNEQTLHIASAVNEPVTITWQLSAPTEAHHFILQPKAKKALKELDDFQRLTNFFITPYGEYKQWVSWETLGFAPTNYAPEIVKAASDKTKNVSLAIEPALKETGWFRDASKVLPYTIKIVAVTRYPFPIDFLNEETRRFPPSELPRVKKALETGEKVLPRYVFSLGDQASITDLEREYKSLQRDLQPVTHGKNKEDASIAHNLLEIIEAAYTTLKSEFEFDKKITKFKSTYKA